MATTLTADDFRAIGAIVKETVQPIIDELAQDTAAGFAEVHTKVATLQQTLDRVEQVQLAEVVRNDHQDLAIGRIRKALRTA